MRLCIAEELLIPNKLCPVTEPQSAPVGINCENVLAKISGKITISFIIPKNTSNIANNPIMTISRSFVLALLNKYFESEWIKNCPHYFF